MQLTPRHIAIIAYEGDRLYCLGMGYDVPPPWDEAPEHKKDRALQGVMNIKVNPDFNAKDFLFTTIVKACLNGRLTDGFLEASMAAKKQAEVK